MSTPFYGLDRFKVRPKEVLIRVCKDCKKPAAKGKSRCLKCFDKQILTTKWG
jgi:hypothetical protein